MKKSTRLLAGLLAATMTIGAAVLSIGAAETPLVSETFDDYNDGYLGKDTKIASVFTIEEQSIGDSWIKVVEDPNSDQGNLMLQSHVFTQVYNTNKLMGAYTFSLDVYKADGNRNCAIFVRAPKCDEAAYYEHDATDDSNASCRAGIVINCRGPQICVNIKSYSASETSNEFGLKQNEFLFDLPEGVSIGRGSYTNLKVEDDGNGTIKIYVAQNLVCSIVLSSPNTAGYAAAKITDACYTKAVIYGADSAQLGSVDNPTAQAGGSTVGWATRVANMWVDGVYLSEYTNATDIPNTPENPDPSETQPSDEESTPVIEESDTIVEDGDTTPVESDTTVAEESDTTLVEESETTAETEVTADTTADDTTAETEADTTATTSNETTAAPVAGGCSSSVAIGGLAVLFGAAFVALKKKD